MLTESPFGVVETDSQSQSSYTELNTGRVELRVGGSIPPLAISLIAKHLCTPIHECCSKSFVEN
jgi:hypothetical protein